MDLFENRNASIPIDYLPDGNWRFTLTNGTSVTAQYGVLHVSFDDCRDSFKTTHYNLFVHVHPRVYTVNFNVVHKPGEREIVFPVEVPLILTRWLNMLSPRISPYT